MSWRKQIAPGACSGGADRRSCGVLRAPPPGSELSRGWNNIAYLGPSARHRKHWPRSTANTSCLPLECRSPNLRHLLAGGAGASSTAWAMVQTGDSIWDRPERGKCTTVVELYHGYRVGPGNRVFARQRPCVSKVLQRAQPGQYRRRLKRYFAPVIIPNGATITSMTAAFRSLDWRRRPTAAGLNTPITNGST